MSGSSDHCHHTDWKYVRRSAAVYRTDHYDPPSYLSDQKCFRKEVRAENEYHSGSKPGQRAGRKVQAGSYRCPETAFEEYETTAYIKRQLDAMGISYKPLYPTGIVAEIGKGREAAALRADIDALKVEEETGCSFGSEHQGYMHACGHDGHAAILLGTAGILKKHEKELSKKVFLVFQPAEETAQGAKLVLESGLLEDVKEIFGLHIFSGTKPGRFHWRRGREWLPRTGFL